MTFARSRNPALEQRFTDIARWYQYFGNAWRVRWDYAFFQMIVETNYLRFRRPDGRRGDVTETQNNFAGLGATGGGVPGDRFPDVKTGVHAQIQHLVAYSGERLASPIAPRTRLKQDDIVSQSLDLGRPVTFSDLARRWAADREYGRTIEYVANEFRSQHCTRSTAELKPPQPVPARRNVDSRFPRPSGLGGPTPAKLAGPEVEGEVLPWQVQETPSPPLSNPVPSPPPALSENKSPPKRPPPFRTIWSRNEQAAPSPAPAAAPEPVPASEPPATGSVEPAAASATEQPIQLPTFRITPVGPEPSRLGGPVPPPPVPVSKNCRIVAASYGGSKTLLLKSAENGKLRLTALTVLDGFEKSMVETYTRAHALKADVVGEYPTQAEAMADAQTSCPD